MWYLDDNVTRKQQNGLLKSYKKVQRVLKNAFFLVTKFRGVQTWFFKFLSTFKTSLLEQIFPAILIPHELKAGSVIFLYHIEMKETEKLKTTPDNKNWLWFIIEKHTGLLIFKYTRDNNYYSCILVLNITKAGFQHKPRIFFLFCDLDFMIFFEIFVVIHGYFGHKTWKPFVVFMKLGKKKFKPGGFWRWYSWNSIKK